LKVVPINRLLSLKMKLFYFNHRGNRAKAGFSMVEATLSIGVMSFGFLALVPLLALGAKTARQAHDSRATTQIAQTLIEEARQGTLSSGVICLDGQGNPCSPAQAIYTVQALLQPVAGNPASATGAASSTRLTLRVTPTGAPDHARIYALVLSAP
jgi:uncharacterized protein (TIGR02598 family)